MASELIEVGRMECAHGSTAQPLYVTIVNDTIELRAEQQAQQGQRWCLVRVQVPLREDRFIICSHPTTNCVLQARNEPIAGYQNAYRVRVVKLDKNITPGQPLPIPMDETYQFQYRRDSDKPGYRIVSLSGFIEKPVMQGGYMVGESAKDPPKLNDLVTIHKMEMVDRELFWFDTLPKQ